MNLRLPFGNLATRIVGAALALPFLGPIAHGWARLSRRRTARREFPYRFQRGGGCRSSSGSSRSMAKLLVRLLPERPASDDPAKPLYLDPAAIGTPAVALANAARETLRMADVVEKMLAGTQTSFHGDHRH